MGSPLGVTPVGTYAFLGTWSTSPHVHPLLWCIDRECPMLYDFHLFASMTSVIDSKFLMFPHTFQKHSAKH